MNMKIPYIFSRQNQFISSNLPRAVTSNALFISKTKWYWLLLDNFFLCVNFKSNWLEHSHDTIYNCISKALPFIFFTVLSIYDSLSNLGYQIGKYNNHVFFSMYYVVFAQSVCTQYCIIFQEGSLQLRLGKVNGCRSKESVKIIMRKYNIIYNAVVI